MFSLLRKLKSLAVILTIFSFVIAISVTSCTTKEKADAVESAEGDEHPAQDSEEASEEHPESSTGEEHPSDSTATGDEHPSDSDGEEHPSEDEEDSEE